jgi:transcriptional regulator of met regulon
MIEKAGDEVSEALLKRRVKSLRKLLGDLLFRCHKGKFYKGRFYPDSERDCREERREMAIAGLHRVWAEMGVDPDVGMEKLLVMEEGQSRRRHPDDYW